VTVIYQGGEMPIATVAAIIKNDNEKILLTRRGAEPFKGLWCLPGGHIDENEKALDAIIREAKEETGLDFDAEFLFYADEIIPEINWHAVVLVFTGKGTGELAAQEGEVADIAWFSLEEARSLPLAFVHNQILDEYFTRSNSSTHKSMRGFAQGIDTNIKRENDRP
jgi:8-oxo-dGTP diphosphatase